MSPFGESWSKNGRVRQFRTVSSVPEACSELWRCWPACARSIEAGSRPCGTAKAHGVVA